MIYFEKLGFQFVLLGYDVTTLKSLYLFSSEWSFAVTE